MSNKAQSAIEFLIIVAAVIFFVILFIISIGINTSDKIKQNREQDLSNIAETVVDEINIAHSASEGYSRNFTLPNKVLSEVDYNIALDSGLVFAKTLDDKTSLALPTQNVTGVINKGNNQIRKSNGTVYLNSP